MKYKKLVVIKTTTITHPNSTADRKKDNFSQIHINGRRKYACNETTEQTRETR